MTDWGGKMTKDGSMMRKRGGVEVDMLVELCVCYKIRDNFQLRADWREEGEAPR